MTHTTCTDTIEVDGMEIAVTITFVPRSTKDGRSFDAKTRVFGAVDALAPELAALEPKCIWHQPETEAEKLQDKVWNAWKSQTKKAASQRLSLLISQLAEKPCKGIEFVLSDPAKNTFSSKAGCTCGCSPGFVLDGRVQQDWRNVDIFLDGEVN